MAEVFSSNETVVELLNPITGATLYTATYTRDLSLSERPVYVERAFARSGAVTAHKLRSKGSITLRKDAESLDLVRELKRWQQGVTYYAFSSDLRGKTYRHPNLRLTMTNADGTVERQIAYGVRLSDRTLSRPDGSVVSDAISLDVLRGFDLSATEAADSGRPMRALDFARTGQANYLNTAGTLTTATDGQARIGLPYVVRRNLVDDITVAGAIATGSGTITYSSYTDAQGNTYPTHIVALTGASTYRKPTQSGLPAGTYSVSFYVRRLSGSGNVAIDLGDGGAFSINPTADFTRQTLTLTKGAGTGLDFLSTATTTIEVYGYQVEAALSPLQPTKAGAVDLTHAANGAGLVLEGGTTNKLTSNVATGTDTSAATTGFQTMASFQIATGATLTSDTAQFFQGSRSLKVVTPGSSASEGVETSSSAVSGLAANTVYTASVRIKGTAGQRVNLLLRDYTNSVSASAVPVTLTGGWDTASITITTGGTTPTDLRMAVSIIGTAATTYWLDTLQIEPLPFPTSWVDGTRNPDLCGIVSPHNELLYAKALDQWPTYGGKSAGASITGSNATAVDSTLTADTLTLAATTDSVYQAVSNGKDFTAASVTRTFAVVLKAGTLSGSVKLRIEDQGGTQISASGGSSTPTGGDVVCSLSSSAFQTFWITVTPGATVTGLRLKILGNSGTGTVIFDSARLVQGSHPGIDVRTTDTAIPKPADGGLDPAWVQNVRIKGNFVLPSGANVTAGTAILGYSGGILITQFASTITLSRASNGGTRSVSITLNAADGNRHSFDASCGNYTTSAGVRSMPLTLTVDSTTATIDAASLFGDSSWSTPDQTKLISGGTVYSTLSALSLESASIPAGAIPA